MVVLAKSGIDSAPTIRDSAKNSREQEKCKKKKTNEIYKALQYILPEGI